MEEKIKIPYFIKSLADMTLETSVLGDEKIGSKKTLEEFGKIKLNGSNITELLVAELFVSQIPLNKFLINKDKATLLDLYFLEIYKLILNKYKYFKFKEELKLFEILIGERFPEYYKIFNDPKSDTFVALGGKVSNSLVLEEPIRVIFSMMLGIYLGNRMIAINNFIKEVSEKFEIEKYENYN